MLLVTKEVFLQVKTLTNMHINVQAGPQYPGQPQGIPQYQVFLQGIVADPNNNNMGMPDFQVYVTCASKEDAYRIYNDLMKQIVDSGTIPELNSKLVDDLLKEK